MRPVGSFRRSRGRSITPYAGIPLQRNANRPRRAAQSWSVKNQRSIATMLGLAAIAKRRIPTTYRMPKNERSTNRKIVNTSSGGCRLYTPDAADDMQRVEHGGRRITKKEHTQQPIQ